ncbi:hypothetical protein EON66_02770 [archaeon]|nr:MAG: hypothetical protein EON66_02770 [archaeon]
MDCEHSSAGPVRAIITRSVTRRWFQFANDMPSESQLALWLNTEVYPPLPRPVGSIDHDFSNGYLLGHLCARLAPQLAFPTPLDSSFTTALHDADTPSAKLANFGQVMGLLNSVGVRLSMEDVDAVATEQRGAATALLLRIKDVLDQKQRRATTASAAGGSSKTGTGSMSPSSPLRGTRRARCRIIFTCVVPTMLRSRTAPPVAACPRASARTIPARSMRTCSHCRGRAKSAGRVVPGEAVAQTGRYDFR